MRQRAIISAVAGLAAVAVSGCTYDSYGYGPPGGDYAYAGADWRDRGPLPDQLDGPGVAILDPWLLETEEGREIVMLGFHDAAGGFVSEEVAHRANIWFRRHADTDCDMRLTDPEIRIALANSATFQHGGY